MRKINYLLLSFVFSGVFFQCSDKDQQEQRVKRSPRIRKAVKLESPRKKQNYLLGDDIFFKVSHRDKIPIDSLKLSVGEITITEAGDNITWTAGRTGSPDLKVTAYYDDNTEIVYPKVSIKPADPPEEYIYQVVADFPHDQDAYTQGLFFLGDTLIESTGSESSGGGSGSSLRKILYQNGEVLQIVNLDDKYFGEGCTIWQDKIYQLTWTSKKAFVYDRDLNRINTFNYSTEGWGITTWGDVLLMSDGSEVIYVMNPRDFSEIDRLEVFDDKGKIDQLNELEIIENVLYANIYGEDRVVGIDPKSGAVIESIDFEGLVDRRSLRGVDYAMNGIAYKREEKRIFVTGKWWPKLFEIILIPKSGNS